MDFYDMRKLINIATGVEKLSERDNTDTGGMDITYSIEDNGKTEKIVAYLKSYDSARYTNLAKKFIEIEKMEKEIKKLKEEVKQETRVLVADLFDAEDIVRTRVVKTVSYTYTLSKNPKPTETYQYAKILDALEKELTPDLINKLNVIKESFKTVVQKAPSLKVEPNVSESISDKIKGVWGKLKDFFANLKNKLTSWGNSYDRKLDALFS